MNQRISVIVPIYKVEQYLNECIESIIKQTYENLEIILVNDGSPDRCPQICEEWSEKDKRVKVIHKENGGLSDARNAGLAAVRGDYVVFVDSDDSIDKKYIEGLYSVIINEGAEIAACNIKCFYDEDELGKVEYNFEDVRVCNSEEALQDLTSGIGFRAVAWNKMYKSSLLRNEWFEKGRYHEDEFFTYRILDKAQKLAYVNVELYNYRQRQGSIMSTFSIKHVDALDAYIERLDLFKEKYPVLYKKDKIGFCISCAMHYRLALKNETLEHDKILNRIKACRKRIKFTIKEFFDYSVDEKIYILGTAYCLDILCRVLNYRRGVIDEKSDF